jgi:hypothetical protein
MSTIDIESEELFYDHLATHRVYQGQSEFSNHTGQATPQPAPPLEETQADERHRQGVRSPAHQRLSGSWPERTTLLSAHLERASSGFQDEASRIIRFTR